MVLRTDLKAPRLFMLWHFEVENITNHIHFRCPCCHGSQ
ncbi:cold-shock protein, partial [Escherichia coli]|nr:cold-shock protein [Escherichia coli]